jgi:hypothetical protein
MPTLLEQLALAIASTLFRPELGPDLMRAWRRRAGDARVEMRDLAPWGVWDRVVPAVARGMSVQELLAWVGRETALLLPAVIERAERGELGDARRLAERISARSRRERGLAWAYVARAEVRLFLAPDTSLARALDAADPGGEVLSALSSFLGPDHPAVRRMAPGERPPAPPRPTLTLAGIAGEPDLRLRAWHALELVASALDEGDVALAEQAVEAMSRPEPTTA